VTPRRRANLAAFYDLVQYDTCGEDITIEVDGVQVATVELWRSPYAGLDNDARAACAVLLERAYERCEYRA
jgi:hypothetical protein